jgi:hypothetical protein
MENNTSKYLIQPYITDVEFLAYSKYASENNLGIIILYADDTDKIYLYDDTDTFYIDFNKPIKKALFIDYTVAKTILAAKKLSYSELYGKIISSKIKADDVGWVKEVISVFQGLEDLIKLKINIF